MPTPFMCHECDGYTMNISGVCDKCGEAMIKQRPYKGKDKKDITDMSARKRKALENWSANHAKKKFKPRKPNEPSIKIKVGMEYKDEG